MPKKTTPAKTQPVKTHRLALLRAASGAQQRALTREHIVECAIPVFAVRGPDAPLIGDFVMAAGIARGTFYNYFKTTRELLEAAFEALSDEVIGAIVPVVEGMPNPVVRFATAARIYYRWATADPTLVAFLSSASHAGSLAAEHTRHDLSQAMAEGLMDVRDMDLALAVAGGVMAFALRAPRSAGSSDERGRAVTQAILAGLGVRAALRRKALAIQLPELTVPQTLRRHRQA